MARFAVAAMVFALVGCGKRENGEAKHKAENAEVEARRDLAQRNTRGNQRMRASGDDATVLEVGSTGVCTQGTLADVIANSGPGLIDLGFKRLKCMGGSVEVTLGSPPEIAKPAAVVVDVTAKQLLADYQENEIAADAKYKGQALRVNGKVTRISKDIFDAPLVDLATSNEFMPVYATFTNEGALAELKRGQQVTVRCRSKGVSMAHPLLEDCVLEPTRRER